MLDAAAEDGADVLEELRVGLVELRLQLRRHGLAVGDHVAHLHAETGRGLHLRLGLLGL